MLLLSGLVYQVIGTEGDARRYPAPGRLVAVNGVRLHIYGMGETGPVVVLDAGIAASSVSWSLVQPEVAKFARVFSYDRAGLGWSEPAYGGPRPRTAANSAEELHALLTGAGIAGPYILAGHSFGGYVARAFAHAYPREVAGIVLVDSPDTSEWKFLDGDRKRRLRGGAFFSRIGAVLAGLGVVRACLALLSAGATGVPRLVTQSFGKSAANLAARMVGQVRKLPPQVWPIVRAHWSRPKSFRSMASHLAHLPESAAYVEACGPLGDVPLVVLTASNPTSERVEQQDAVARLSSQGRHIVAATAGHWIHLDEPALVVEAIRSVCETASRLRSPQTVS